MFEKLAKWEKAYCISIVNLLVGDILIMFTPTGRWVASWLLKPQYLIQPLLPEFVAYIGGILIIFGIILAYYGTVVD